MDGPATQLTPPPVNHPFHGHINDPHYVAWPYGVALCVCVCVMYEHECLRRRVCSAVLKADCAGDEAKLLVTSLRISLLGYGDRGNMAAELGGQP